jgi:hypothetical protein
MKAAEPFPPGARALPTRTVRPCGSAAIVEIDSSPSGFTADDARPPLPKLGSNPPDGKSAATSLPLA